jgi:hypothetical protein
LIAVRLITDDAALWNGLHKRNCHCLFEGIQRNLDGVPSRVHFILPNFTPEDLLDDLERHWHTARLNGTGDFWRTVNLDDADSFLKFASVLQLAFKYASEIMGSQSIEEDGQEFLRASGQADFWTACYVAASEEICSHMHATEVREELHTKVQSLLEVGLNVSNEESNDVVEGAVESS